MVLTCNKIAQHTNELNVTCILSELNYWRESLAVFMRNIIPVYTQERNSTNSIWKISRFSSHLIQKVSLSKTGMKQGADLISHLISSRKKIDLYFDGNRTSSLFSNSILPCYPCFPTENLIRWWKICKSRYIQSSYHNEGF